MTNSEAVQEIPVKTSRGRKPKYIDNEARKVAKREQNRRYRERKRNELESLRRLAASIKESESSENNSEIESLNDTATNVAEVIPSA